MYEGVEEEEKIHNNRAWKYTNEDILSICHAVKRQEFIEKQNKRLVAHVVRASDECIAKRLCLLMKNTLISVTNMRL